MKRRVVAFLLMLLACPSMVWSQDKTGDNYGPVFEAAYKAFPDLPRGLLEAVSFTNTQCHHLTDGNYFNHDADAMPRAYGLMGLVKDGKDCFRENLYLVADLSGFSEKEILEDPMTHVMAYAKAFHRLANETDGNDIKNWLAIVQQLSELPIGEEDAYPMQSMLYSVCLFLNDAEKAGRYGFEQFHIDMPAVFSVYLDMLTAPELSLTRESDYPLAIWSPAPECNWGSRTKQVSAVVIHYTEGSYAGCISWFKNCDSHVSAHYVIRSADGQVTQMVHEKDMAWHARTANGYSIGIEHEAYGNIWSFFTEEMYQSSANLVRDICSRYAVIDGHRTFYRDTLDNGICLNKGLHDLGGEEACTKIRGHQHYPDQSHTDPGPYWDWNYYYKLINEGTPVVVLEGEEGRFDHQNYEDDERKVWVIRTPEGSKTQLEFNSFGLEADYDFLWIYDGDDIYAPKIGRWNTHSPGIVQASGNVMCVEFRSDCGVTGSGWKASWSTIIPVPIEPENDEFGEGVFPNPTNGKFTICSNREGFTDVRINDVCGKTMMVVRFIDRIEIDASDWAPGVYIVNYGEPTVFDNRVKLVKF